MASFDCTLHIRFEYHQFVDDLPLSLFSSPCYVGQLEGAVPSRIDVHHLTFQPTNDPRKGSLSFFLGFEHWVLPNNHIRSHQVMPWAWRKLRILHTGERTCPNISKSGELHGQTGHKKVLPGTWVSWHHFHAAQVNLSEGSVDLMISLGHGRPDHPRKAAGHLQHASVHDEQRVADVSLPAVFIMRQHVFEDLRSAEAGAPAWRLPHHGEPVRAIIFVESSWKS